MKFVKITEIFETFNDGQKLMEVNNHINIDMISFIRETTDGSLLVFMTGRDKAIKVVNKDSIDALIKATKIKAINE